MDIKAKVTEILKNNFDQRVSKNDSYSLRAYARDLSVSPSFLSEVFKGKKNLSLKQSKSAFDSLKLHDDQSLRVLKHLEEKETLNKESEIKRVHNLYDQSQLDEDEVNYLSHWHYLAIVEFLKIIQPPITIQEISHGLEVKQSIVEKAIKRLENMRMIERLGDTITPLKDEYSFLNSDDLPNQALRNFHKSTYQLYMDRVDQIPTEERDISSITIAIDESKLELAKAEIKQFRRYLSALLESDESSRVYNLSIQLFPLSKSINKNQNEVQ